MRNFAIGDLPLIVNNVVQPNFILQTPIEGMESPERRTNSYSKPGANGGVTSSEFYDPRIMSLVGTVYGNNPIEFETARKKLILATSIKKDEFGYPVPTRITFTTLAGNDYFVDVHFGKPVMPYDMPNQSDFMIPATADNPFLFGTTPYTTGNITTPVSSGYISPYISPYTTGASTGGIATVNNIGSESSNPIVYLYGPLTTPTIYSSTVGKYIQLNYTLASGDVVTIDMAKKAIILNGSSGLNTYKSAGSDWFKVSPGLNSFSFSTGSSSDTGYAVVMGDPPFIGT